MRALARDELEWPDQDALNVVLGARRFALHPRWNRMNSLLLFPSDADVFGAEPSREARERPGDPPLRGPGANKPWHYLCDAEERERLPRAIAARRRGPRVRARGRDAAQPARRWRARRSVLDRRSGRV